MVRVRKGENIKGRIRKHFKIRVRKGDKIRVKAFPNPTFNLFLNKRVKVRERLKFGLGKGLRLELGKRDTV